ISSAGRYPSAGTSPCSQRENCVDYIPHSSKNSVISSTQRPGQNSGDQKDQKDQRAVRTYPLVKIENPRIHLLYYVGSVQRGNGNQIKNSQTNIKHSRIITQHNSYRYGAVPRISETHK